MFHTYTRFGDTPAQDTNSNPVQNNNNQSTLISGETTGSIGRTYHEVNPPNFF